MTEYTKNKISKSLTKQTVCNVQKCDEKPLAKNYCQHHYNTIYRK